MPENLSHRAAALVLLMALLLGTLLVNPSGDFPLNDDWAYAKSVKHLVETGELMLVNWPAMTLVAQIYWGALFCWLFGFSFTVLRMATLLTSLLTVFVFYRLAAGLTTDRRLALFVALLLLLNPLYFSLSFTFMTEVHFQLVFLLSVAGFVAYLHTARLGWLMLAMVFSVIATLIRQTGLFVPLIFAPVCALHYGRSRASLLAGLPLLAAALTMLGYNLWLKYGVDYPVNIGRISDLWYTLRQYRLHQLVEKGSSFLYYLGLFVLPVVVLLSNRIRRVARRLPLPVWVLLLFVSLTIAYFHSGFPFGNVLYNLGLGPKLVKDTYWEQNIDPQLPGALWLAGLRILGWLGISGLLFLLLGQGVLRSRLRPGSPLIGKIRIGLLGVVLIFLAFHTVLPSYYDRYILPPLSLTLLVVLPLASRYSRRALAGALTVLGILALFSLLATHDYLAWNRARWSAVDYLINERGFSIRQIDAGVEVNAWLNGEGGGFHPVDPGGPGWWFVTDEEYLLSFGPVGPYPRIASFAYSRWLPPGQDSLHVWYTKRTYDSYPIRSDAETRSKMNYNFLTNRAGVTLGNGDRRSETRARSGRAAVESVPHAPYGFTVRFRDVRPGETFRARVWRQREERAALVLTGIDGNGYWQESDNIIATEGDWQLLELEVTLPDTITFTRAGIYTFNPGPDTAWFDDIEIWRLPAEEMAPRQQEE